MARQRRLGSRPGCTARGGREDDDVGPDGVRRLARAAVLRGRGYLVTVGRDVRGAAVAAKVNDVINLVTAQNATFTDPQPSRSAGSAAASARQAR